MPPGGGELLGDAPDRRVEVLSEHDSLHATWSRFGAGRDGAELHVHQGHTDLFFVLAGELTLKLGPSGAELALPAGSLARVPPMVAHGFRNASAGEVRYLNLHAPGAGFIAYMRGLRDSAPVPFDQHEVPAGGGRPVTEAAIESGAGVLCDEPAIRAELTELAEVTPARGRLRSAYVLDGEGAGTLLQLEPGAEEPAALPGRARCLDVLTPVG